MDDKLNVIQELLTEINEIRSLSPSSFTKSSEAQNIADDVIHKLLLIRKMISSPASPSRSTLNTYAVLNGDKSPTSPTPLRKSSTLSYQRYFVTHAVLNDEENADPREVARTAYDAENYAKCIRVIDKIIARQDGKLDCEMMHLCHDSYKKIVDGSANEKESCKLREWWRLFLERVVLSDACHDYQLQLIDCRAECAWEMQKHAKTDDERMHLIEQLMNLKIEAYEHTAIMYRPFHMKCLRRIQKICALVVDYFERFPDNERVPLCIDEGIELSRYALDEAKVDAVEYAKEADASSEDLCYLESAELIKEIELILYKHGYLELLHSDTESDCVISSEDGHEPETKKVVRQIYSKTEEHRITQKPRPLLIVEEVSAAATEECVTRF